MWQLNCEEGWALKNWCFWTVVLEKTLESPLDCKVIQPVHPKEDLSWLFIGRTNAKAETPIFWPPDAKSWLIWKDRDAGKDWRQEEKGMTEDEMVGWHHLFNGHRFGWTLGVGDGQGGLVCCSLWGHKESDTTEPLNWTDSGLVGIEVEGRLMIINDCVFQTRIHNNTSFSSSILCNSKYILSVRDYYGTECKITYIFKIIHIYKKVALKWLLKHLVQNYLCLLLEAKIG